MLVQSVAVLPIDTQSLVSMCGRPALRFAVKQLGWRRGSECVWSVVQPFCFFRAFLSPSFPSFLLSFIVESFLKAEAVCR